MTIRAAGILAVTADGKALFLKRGPGSDYPGKWCFPGGRLEEGETSLSAAVRETQEEAGKKFAEKDLTLWTTRVAPGMGENAEPVEFTTYLARDVEQFAARLGPREAPEHEGFVWAPINEPPQPLHPGCAVALARFAMNELDLAKAIRDGELTSPQKYINVWLFDLRITGTDLAERKALDEIAYRNPDHYLTPEFLERCAGLPVILEHPAGNLLNSDEYAKRNIGSIMLPYLKGNEVWGVAKIFDEGAAQYMSEEVLSTSPSVAWKGDNTTVVIGGKKVLIENEPGLVDHVAVVSRGVWDKGGDPTGIPTSRGDSNIMDKEEFAKWQAAQEARTAAMEASITGIGTALTGFTGALTAIGDSLAAVKSRADADDEEKAKEKKADARGRADSFKFSKRGDGESDDDYKARHDAEEKACADAEKEAGETEETAADKARKRRGDAEDEEKKERADAARADADRSRADADKTLAAKLAEVQAELAAVKGSIPAVRNDTDLNALYAVQARADAIVTVMDGSRARAPLAGESLLAYRKHWLEAFKAHSPRFKDTNVAAVAADEATFTAIEAEIYKDAEEFAKSPARTKPGELRRITRRSDTGHTIHEYVGQPDTWMAEFAGPVRHLAQIHDRPVLRNAAN